jgi:hypothetical protein
MSTPVPIPAAEVLLHARRLSKNAALGDVPSSPQSADGLTADAGADVEVMETVTSAPSSVVNPPPTPTFEAGPATVPTVERREAFAALDKKPTSLTSSVTPIGSAGQGAAGVLRSPAVVQGGGICCKPSPEARRTPFSSAPPPHAS